uniref:WD repeat domain phosphoinositide-interacting protein 3 n=1 Tax=Haptolina brevifila TaxID=156173 RepID=A0A7S2JL68_9EUKA|mmetsp:Transcript_84179/g.168024  ORF Transcript_84179/g.168024 Transcript_84179/m.168024 type:complete len:381 (+) Transcript_84179:132-1274(+)|eukprot:CAMPEP_0174697802 /NCGR_PEP_ID=MMETSP1094-20130205/3561_1 /TAXON_ID=156173 /ORGANISM="Chrysochromulina brevifilum, Strain UTEX LB 985" /LENGTH=380 /DNA_ID=CAMNT_0015894855 /DNA_START=128 /DNA_END=1270 /DNA_ORIENTATION=+
MAMRLDAPKDSELLYVNFNQDQGCFACGTNSGFRIFNCDPFKQTFRRDFGTANGGLGIVEMLFRCNILALVGGGQSPRYPPNKVMIWDDHQNRPIGELTYRSNVKAVRMSRENVVVALEYWVRYYDFGNLNERGRMETVSNPKGLCALAADSSKFVLACPGLQKGQVRIEYPDINRNTRIPAHESTLACLNLNNDGTRLATASERGTLVRVWDCMTGDRLYELRRGAEPAEIQCLSFNLDSGHLLVSSDHGTIHIFKLLDEPVPAAQTTSGSSTPASAAATPRGEGSNTKSNLAFLTSYLPKSITPTYIQSQWSFAQFRLPGSEKSSTRSIAAFGGTANMKNVFLVVCADGTFYKCRFDPLKGGECVREDCQRFLFEEEE